VHPQLFAELVRLADEFNAPLAMHLAESRGELELLARGTGEFLEFLQRLGVWRPDAIAHGTRPMDYLRPLSALNHALVIHGNYLADDEIEFLSGCETITVVYCPRTHAFFGHDPHPWRRLSANGANVAIGTDSRASNPDLSVWNELSFLHTHFPDVPPSTLLELGTIRGARALGLGHETGSLPAGKAADLAVVSLPPADSTDPYALLFDPDAEITGTMCRGMWTAK
jgi:cytosine/adenosine deaminase-related metal-dependent hydrolase